MRLYKKVPPWFIVLVVLVVALALAVAVRWPQESYDYLRALTPAWATVIGGVIGGSIIGAGALLGFKASMETRKTMEKSANMTHEREVMSARQDRYTTIAEQLSSQHEAVRLAGVYALAALADEWQKAGELGQRDVAVKLLCAYLRGKPRTSGSPNGAVTKDREVRSAVISIIQSRTHAEAELQWPARLIDLSGAELRGAFLPGAFLSGADLSKADLWEADLSGADLSGALLIETNLSRASLRKSNLQGARLPGADLQGADLFQTNLLGTLLSGANLSGAFLSQANLMGALMLGADLLHAILLKADLTGAFLSQANLTQANLSGANLSQANLSGANLSQADLTQANLTEADLSGANLTEAELSKAELHGAIGLLGGDESSGTSVASNER